MRTYSKSNKKKFVLDTNVRYLHSPMTDNANAASVKQEKGSHFKYCLVYLDQVSYDVIKVKMT